MIPEMTPSPSFSSRLMAILIDLALLAGLTVSTIAAVAGVFLLQPDPPLAGVIACAVLLPALFIMMPPVITFLYFLILHACGGQTLGKIFMGIQVRNADGGPVVLGQSFLRLTGYLVSAMPLAAGFLWAAVSRKGLAWHDRIACTEVVSIQENTLTDATE